MITFRRYLKELNEFANKYPQSLDCRVIYSRDDEGNEYQEVVNDIPIFVQLENPNARQYRNLEIVGFFELDDSISIEDCNAVLIN